MVVLVTLALAGAACEGSNGTTRPPDHTPAPTATSAAAPDATPSARELLQVGLDWSALSPAGDRLLGFFGDIAEAQGALAEWCLVDVDGTAPEDCTEGPPAEIGWPPLAVPAWSPDGDLVAWTAAGDIWLLDAATGDFRALTDDGLHDFAPAALGQVPVDQAPTWLTPDEVAFLRESPETGLLEALQVVTVAGEERPPVLSPTFERESLTGPVLESQWYIPGPPPYVAAPDEVLVGGYDRLFSVDPGAGEVAVVGDYGEEIAPIFDLAQELGVAVPRPRGLYPVGETASGEVILYDPVVRDLQLFGEWPGAPSGFYLFDPAADELVPVFEPSPEGSAYVGPTMLALSPERARLAVVWLDERAPAGGFTSHLSLLDLATVDLPASPRDLPELWSSDRQAVVPRSPAATWSAGDRIALPLDEVSTLVLQLDGLPPGGGR